MALSAQNLSPAVGAGNIARPKQTSFTIPELVEEKERVIADALKVAVVGCSLLLAVHRPSSPDLTK